MAKKSKKTSFIEKAFVTWIKFDPLVNLVVKNDNQVRRDVMLNLIGRNAAVKYFGKFPARKTSIKPIFPQNVREEVETNLTDPENRTQLIKKLIHWATDPMLNNLAIDSHVTRIQIITSLLGPVFFHSNLQQEDLILRGIKFMLVNKPTIIGKRGEQSYDVHYMLLGKIREILIHNQKVIINKAVKEAEEKMRVHLLRQIQEIRGERATNVAYGADLKIKVNKIIKEKFPLRTTTQKHFTEMLQFYSECNWPTLKLEAEEAIKKIEEIRKPLTLTEKDIKR